MNALDPATLALTLTILVAVGLLTSLVSAYRASSIDPAEALRSE